MKYLGGRGFENTLHVQSSLPLEEFLNDHVSLGHQVSEKPIAFCCQSTCARLQILDNENFNTHYGVLLIARGKIKGALEVFRRQAIFPEKEWLTFLETIASQCATAIDNAELLGDLKRSNAELSLAYDTTLDGWIRALGLRDKETEGHTQRVTYLTMQLAQNMGLNPEDVKHMRRGALLHDIGKMGISDSILNKPGPLSENEWKIMKQHPIYALDLLSPIPFLKDSLDIPYCHHERWDGSGYPHKLKGNEIPLSARIFAVLDVWDALCSNRPYRKAWTKTKAQSYIKQQSGKLFDPQVVDSFFSMGIHRNF